MTETDPSTPGVDNDQNVGTEGTSTPSPEEEAAGDELAVNETLKDGKFAEFLVKVKEKRTEYTDIEDISDADILKFHEAFVMKKEASQKLSELYQQEIFNALKLNTAEVRQESKECIDEYLEEVAIDNPEGIKEVVVDMETYQKTLQDIAERQAILNKLGATAQEFDNSISELERLKIDRKNREDELYDDLEAGQTGFKNRTKQVCAWLVGKEYHSAREKSADEELDFVQKEMEQIDKALPVLEANRATAKQTQTELGNLNTTLTTLKTQYCQSLDPMEKIHDILLRAANQELTNRYVSTKLTDLDTAEKEIDAWDDPEINDLDYFGGNELNITKENVQEQIRLTIQNEVRSHIDSAKGESGLPAFEKTINKFYDERPEYRDTINQVLADKLSELRFGGKSEEMKRLYITRIQKMIKRREGRTNA